MAKVLNTGQIQSDTQVTSTIVKPCTNCFATGTVWSKANKAKTCPVCKGTRKMSTLVTSSATDKSNP